MLSHRMLFRQPSTTTLCSLPSPLLLFLSRRTGLHSKSTRLSSKCTPPTRSYRRGVVGTSS
ncbi:hypothetical protein ACRALDRAFT_2035503 [Sodiomyces alcalophilus JCM 7366]|uniref:uncharacterized protein n=1 Tax=Sodiomyces alcalophilus JCM 7366 TaxID=591952 RepID=UPI0039B3C418